MTRNLWLIPVFYFFSNICLQAQVQDYPVRAVPFTKVKLNDKFWLPRIRTNHEVTIPASFERCENTGRVKNFEMAAAKAGKFCTTFPFDDTDIYKTIEGASFSLNLFPDKKLEMYIDTLIDKIAKAQEPDGYLYTARTIDPMRPHKWAGATRWEKERELSHELYNSGHLFEAAVAHYQATGKKSLLNIALKNADLVCSVFGPGKMKVAPGHEVVEMGLVKLYRVTGERKYLETAKFFIDERGHYAGYDPKSGDPWKNGSYWQDHLPVIQQYEAVGHAVRAAYLYSAVADVAALTGDKEYLAAIDSIWNNVVSKKLYLQGGIGAAGDGERFDGNYVLPNLTAYNETCAAIANVFWNLRMFQLHGESKYIDVLERSLYNGLISGVGMDGKSFFYTNAMEVRNTSGHRDLEGERSGWFECSCCPTNVTRLVPSIPGYVYATNNDGLYINLFAASTSDVIVKNRPVKIVQENNYPWDGALTFKLEPKGNQDFSVLIRIPGWARNEIVPSDLYTVKNADEETIAIFVNGKAVDYNIQKGYAVLSRTWKKGDVIKMELPMRIRKVVSNKKIENNIGKVALQRGPLVYCAEWKDNFGQASNIILSPDAMLKSEFIPDLLNGVVVLKGEASAVLVDSKSQQVETKKRQFTAIPYYAWAHRGKGEMMIWLPEKISGVDIISK
jgi:uncharacterized protein